MNQSIELETKRLLLRKFRQEDLEDYFEYIQMEEIGYNCGWQPIKEKEKALERLNRNINANYDVFAIVLKENNKVIGNVTLSIPDKNRYPNEIMKENAREIGFALSKYYWGKGIMTEAVNEVIRYAFEDLKTSVIYSLSATGNQGSANVQEKCGFVPFGDKVEVRWIDKSILTMVQRKITKEEYKERKNENE